MVEIRRTTGQTDISYCGCQFVRSLCLQLEEPESHINVS